MAGFRILLAGGGTGGHLYPALNLGRALRQADPAVRLTFMGAERGIESRILPGSGFEHRLLPMHPLYRSRPWRNLRLLAAAPAVVAGVARAFSELEPELVVGTGGYASAPALLWALAKGIPTALQEQNAQPGLVTRALASRVHHVHLGYPEAAGRLRVGARTAVFTHGNPVAPRGTVTPDGGSFDWPEGRLILLTGGSQGARDLNLRLLEDLEAAERWPEDVRLVWATGPAHYEAVAARVAALTTARHVTVAPFIPNLGAQLDRVTLAIARSGAMFVAELAAAGVPAILVPFPGAAAAHQSSNARAMAEAGAAIVREQAELEHGELWRLAAELVSDTSRLDQMAQAALARGAPDAAERIALDLLELVAASRSGTGGKGD